jgi:hypothetical protein
VFRQSSQVLRAPTKRKENTDGSPPQADSGGARALRPRRDLGVTAGDILEVTNESSHSISFNPVRILRENNHPRETKTFLKFLTILTVKLRKKVVNTLLAKTIELTL